MESKKQMVLTSLSAGQEQTHTHLEDRCQGGGGRTGRAERGALAGTGDRAQNRCWEPAAQPRERRSALAVAERGGTGAGQRPQREGIGEYTQPSHAVVRQKLTQHHKANIVQFLKMTELYFYTLIY